MNERFRPRTSRPKARNIQTEAALLALALLLAPSPALAAAPRFLDLTPPAGEVLSSEEVVLQGEVVDAFRVTVAGETIPLTGTRYTAGPLPLTRCPAEFLLTTVTGTTPDTDLATVRIGHPFDMRLAPYREGAATAAPATLLSACPCHPTPMRGRSLSVEPGRHHERQE